MERSLVGNRGWSPEKRRACTGEDLQAWQESRQTFFRKPISMNGTLSPSFCNTHKPAGVANDIMQMQMQMQMPMAGRHPSCSQSVALAERMSLGGKDSPLRSGEIHECVTLEDQFHSHQRASSSVWLSSWSNKFGDQEEIADKSGRTSALAI
ncbi:hypothetical protein [Tuwongella immobilis]|uniref:hypothetical protein n=1 Tax=Tuwongella immobilis TaxID=692036 RepID=UPI0013A6AC2F|nr:hypothetical protein [Tuwongella immobilis]